MAKNPPKTVMADSQLKLYYFDGKGRAEVARLILTAAGKEFEDVRFAQEGWPKYKPLAPFGQCPILEVDGDFYCQSLAINSYLAREFGFHGKTNLESLKIDQIVQLIEELMIICVDVLHTEEEEERKKATEKTKTEVSPKFLDHFEKLLRENGKGYLVGDRLTLADFAVFDVATGMLEAYVDVNENYPLLKKLVETVRSHNNIGPYIASRPIRPF